MADEKKLVSYILLLFSLTIGFSLKSEQTDINILFLINIIIDERRRSVCRRR